MIQDSAVDLSIHGRPARDVQLARAQVLALQSKAEEAAAELRRIEIDDFVEQRLRSILAGDTPVSLKSGDAGRLLVLHVVPLASLQTPLPGQTRNLNMAYRPFISGANTPRGRRSLLGACLTGGEGPAVRYALVCDSGAVEVVDGGVLSDGFPEDIMPRLRKDVGRSLEVIRDLGASDSGLLLYVAILRAKGAQWQGENAKESESVQQEHVRLPAIALSRFADEEYTQTLRKRLLQVVGLD